MVTNADEQCLAGSSQAPAADDCRARGKPRTHFDFERDQWGRRLNAVAWYWAGLRLQKHTKHCMPGAVQQMAPARRQYAASRAAGNVQYKQWRHQAARTTQEEETNKKHDEGRAILMSM